MIKGEVCFPINTGKFILLMFSVDFGGNIFNILFPFAMLGHIFIVQTPISVVYFISPQQ